MNKQKDSNTNKIILKILERVNNYELNKKLNKISNNNNNSFLTD